jgi:SAM-dependent methyltransferase
MWPVSDAETFNRRQRVIRDLEWAEAERVLRPKAPGRLLDVGCGTGYAMVKARALGFEVTGLEPSTQDVRGVRFGGDDSLKITTGTAEEMPFDTHAFDMVYSSHALEHFHDRDRGLLEIRRVLRPGGMAVIVVPTGTLALLSSLSQLAFTTHLRVGRFLLRNRSVEGLRQILLPPPHGSYARSTWHETVDFGVSNWQRLLGRYFRIEQTILPYLYPWPDFPQIFPVMRVPGLSSSALFGCVHP